MMITKFRFYPAYRYAKLETWLNDMSSEGWRLIDYGLFKYKFQRSDRKRCKYFVYNTVGWRRNDGYYDLSLRYPMLSKTYGIPARQSILNKNIQKNFYNKHIVELDEKKIDGEFQTLVRERDVLLKKMALINLFRLLLLIIGYIILTLLN